jgi:predicted phosphodiesterase
MSSERQQVVFENKGPKNSSPLEILDEIQKLQGNIEHLRGRLLQPTSEVVVNIKSDGPIRIIPISDTHLFSVLTDYDSVKDVFASLNDKNTYAVLCGDFLEFAHPGISSHIGEVMLPAGDQIRLARKILSPYVRSGQLLCMVGVYKGHDGNWSDKLATINAMTLIADGLLHPDGSQLQILINGGDLVVKLSNNEQFRLNLFHDPGGGGSDYVNQVGALRNQGWKRPINGPDKCDVVIGGHRHHRAGVSKERVRNRITGDTETVVYMALGAHKAVEKDRYDSFLTEQGKEESKKPGAGIVLNFSRDEHRIWTTFGYSKLDKLYDAAKYWDTAEKNGVTSELVEKILSRNPVPEAKFERMESRTRTNDVDPEAVPLYEYFKWKITNKTLPLAIYFLGNNRYGSTSGERDRQKTRTLVDIVAKNPLSYLLGMRHLVANEAAKSFDRRAILQALADDLRPVYDDKSILGVELSSSLRNDAWRKDLKKEGEVEEGFLPGDYFYKNLLPGVPIFLNESIMSIVLNNSEYLFLMMDKLQNSGSVFDMFRGLVQSHRKTQLDLDVVVGGHMPGSGFFQTEKSVYIAPGWLSDYDSDGKGNQRRVTDGGQAVILLPNEKAVFPASSMIEAQDIHTALTLQVGLTNREKKLLFSASK